MLCSHSTDSLITVQPNTVYNATIHWFGHILISDKCFIWYTNNQVQYQLMLWYISHWKNKHPMVYFFRCTCRCNKKQLKSRDFVRSGCWDVFGDGICMRILYFALGLPLWQSLSLKLFCWGYRKSWEKLKVNILVLTRGYTFGVFLISIDGLKNRRCRILHL